MFGNTNFNVLLIFITGSIPFFTTTLEEYYTHKMYLGIINGADEGCIGVGLLFIISAILGIYLSLFKETVYGLAL